METKKILNFSRRIKLGPALGDWTKLRSQVGDMQAQIGTVRHVNFDSLSSEDLTVAHTIHYRLGELITQKFSNDMNIKVELHDIEAAQVSYQDFLEMQKDKVVQADLIIPSLGRTNVVLEWKLADIITNRLTGGTGEESPLDQFSEIEVTILKTQIQELIPFYATVWKGIFDSKSVSTEFVCGDYVYDRKISAREAYIYFKFNFYFGKNDLRSITWAYPNGVLRQMLRAKSLHSDSIKKRVDLQPLTLKKTQLPVKCVLGSTMITMNDLQNLQEGDVVRLDAELSSPVEIYIGDKAKLYGQPGFFNGKYGVQIILPEEASGKPLKQKAEIVQEIPEASEILVTQEEIQQSYSEPAQEEDVQHEDNEVPVEAIHHEESIEIDHENELESHEEHEIEAESETEHFETETEDGEEETVEEEIEESHETPEKAQDENQEDEDEDEFSWDDLDEEEEKE